MDEHIFSILDKALSDTSVNLRLAAINRIDKFIVKDAEIFPLLQKALKDPEWEIKRIAIQNLAVAGSKALPSLQRYLFTDKSWVREIAACSLIEMGNQAIPVLVKGLSHPESRISAPEIRVCRHGPYASCRWKNLRFRIRAH